MVVGKCNCERRGRIDQRFQNRNVSVQTIDIIFLNSKFLKRSLQEEEEYDQQIKIIIMSA